MRRKNSFRALHGLHQGRENAGRNDDTRGALGLLWVEQGISFQICRRLREARMRERTRSVRPRRFGAITGGPDASLT